VVALFTSRIATPVQFIHFLPITSFANLLDRMYTLNLRFFRGSHQRQLTLPDDDVASVGPTLIAWKTAEFIFFTNQGRWGKESCRAPGHESVLSCLSSVYNMAVRKRRLGRSTCRPKNQRIMRAISLTTNMGATPFQHQLFTATLESRTSRYADATLRSIHFRLCTSKPCASSARNHHIQLTCVTCIELAYSITGH